MTPQPSLLTLRAALVLLLSFVVAVLAGILSYLVDRSVPAAILVGAGSAGAALALFDKVIDRRT